MCQLNIFLVPKEVKKSKVLSLMQKTMGYKVAERIDEEEPIKNVDEYSFYISGGMRCNCGSLPCRFQDEDPSLTVEETKEKLVACERERLERIKDFMERKDYPKKKRAFDKLYKKYSKDMQAAFDDAGKIERKLTSAILDDKTLTDEEKNKKLHEEVYPKVNELLIKADEDERVKTYHEFLKENDLMWESYAFTLKRDRPKKEKAVPLVEKEGDEEIVEIEIPSFCIYDMIDDVEKKFGFNGMQSEFEGIKSFVSEILKLADKTAVVCFWQDGDEFKTVGKKSVRYADLKIEDLAYLKYGEILTIEK